MPTSAGYPLHRPELRASLAEGDAALGRFMAPPTHCHAGEVLIRAGQASETVYRLVAGWAARWRSLPDGRRQIIALLLPGDLLGIKSMVLTRLPDDVACLTDARVQTVGQEQLRDRVAKDPVVGLRVLFQFAEDERRLHNWVTALGQGRAEERIATLLLDLHGRLHRLGLCDGDAFDLPLLQREIADHLGLTAVHLNRVLRRLREAGLVTVKGGRASVGDVAALGRLAAPLQDIFERAQPEFGGGTAGG